MVTRARPVTVGAPAEIELEALREPAAPRLTPKDGADREAVVDDEIDADAVFRKLGRATVQILIVAFILLVIGIVFVRLCPPPRDHSPQGWAPLPPSHASIRRLAWGSCSKQNLPQDYWRAVMQAEPDVLVLAGDNVYGDCRSAYCDELRVAYDELGATAEFQEAKARLPMIPVWDDHDFGVNDGGASNPWKNLAKELFIDFYELASDDPRRGRDGLYHHYVWGPLGQRVQLIALDTRWFRSSFLDTDEPMAPFKERYIPTNSTSKTMLGDQQWKWLEQIFMEPVDLRILVSSIQVVADGHGWECWRLLPRERERLYSLISGSALRTGGTTVVISGDRHVGGLYRHPDSQLVEVTASSWTHTRDASGHCPKDDPLGCDEPGPDRIGPLVRDNHFGVLDVDWTNRIATLALISTEPDETSGDVLLQYNVSIPLLHGQAAVGRA